jgi:Zn-finger nucleic acid-binding protein
MAAMKYLLARWRMRHTPAKTHLREDQRPQLAAAMCDRCARRWLRGRSLLCPTCGVKLRHAFDLYFERLHDGGP